MLERIRWQAVGIGIAVLLYAMPAVADGPMCQCGPGGYSGTCDAAVFRSADAVTFELDTPKCARVDWYLGDQALATMVKNGQTSLELVDFPEDAATRVRACRVCLSDATTAPPAGEDLLPILRVAPRYPREALRKGLTGYVDVRFRVLADGKTADHVAYYSTDSVFEADAIAAVSQFRYKPRVVNGEAVATDGVEARIRFEIR